MRPILWKHAYLTYCSKVVAAVVAIQAVTPPGHVDGAQVDGVQHNANNGKDGTDYVHEHSTSNLKRGEGSVDMGGDEVAGVIPLAIIKCLTSSSWLDFTDQT